MRGVDRQWLRNLYGFAIAPHMVFYLNIDVKTLIGRVLEPDQEGALLFLDLLRRTGRDLAGSRTATLARRARHAHGHAPTGAVAQPPG